MIGRPVIWSLSLESLQSSPALDSFGPQPCAGLGELTGRLPQGCALERESGEAVERADKPRRDLF